MDKVIYADNAATTKMSKAAADALRPYLDGAFGNASSVHSIGRDAKRALESARVKAARAIGAAPDEIYFTSGGTESDNWAIKGTAELLRDRGKHIITTSVEHSAVKNTVGYLEGKGYEATYLCVDEFGRISLDEMRSAMHSDTILISVMTANNEIGTIMPIAKISAAARERGILLHTDAVQAVGHIPLDVKALGCDMLSMSGHKFGAPVGVGALYIRKGLSLPALIHGGGQEHGGRSGTENIAGICALADSLEDVVSNLPQNYLKVTAMRDRLIAGIMNIPHTRLTGDPDNRLPGIASFVFDGVDGDALVRVLDELGICASSGSACSTGSRDPSHVLTAIGLPDGFLHGSLRLSINENNTDGEIDYILETLPAVIKSLREKSPLWKS